MSRAPVVFGVCVVLLGITGCGGSSDDSTSTPSTSETTTRASTPQHTTPSAQAEEKEKQGKGSADAKGDGYKQQSNDDSPKQNPHLVRVPPISSAPAAGARAPAPGVKTVKGADNSVQEYGVEADESARREAAITLQAYLNARASEYWGAACALLARKPMEQIERLQRAAAKQGTELKSCAQAMALLREGEAELSGQAQITEVLSLRGGGDISGDPSYLLYAAPPSNTLYSMPMYLEGGTWKVGLVRAAELPVG